MIVPGMHPREDWQDPAQPVTGPAPRGDAHTWVVHYPAGNSAPVGDAVPSYLRGIQNNYLNSRGYSIGYSFGVAQDGSMWEIRGDDYNPASNPGRKVDGVNFNNVSRSIFVMVADQDEATPAAVESINAIIATQPGWNVISHGDVDYTSCCGDGLISQVRAGIIGQQDNPIPPDPELEEPIMIAYIGMPPAGIPDNPPWLLCINGSVRYATNVDTAHATANGWAFVELNAEQYPLLLKGAGLA